MILLLELLLHHARRQWSCQPKRSTLVTRLAQDFSRVVHADFHTDSQGRRVRTKHMASTSEMVNSTLWARRPRRYYEFYPKRLQVQVATCWRRAGVYAKAT